WRKTSGKSTTSTITCIEKKSMLTFASNSENIEESFDQRPSLRVGCAPFKISSSLLFIFIPIRNIRNMD
ncbi:hypothetical protein ACT691_03470, partial [Vibrio metschnikovii]